MNDGDVVEFKLTSNVINTFGMSSMSKRVDRKVQRSVLRKLELIHAAEDIEDLGIPSGNRLEKSSVIVVGSTVSVLARNGDSASFGEKEMQKNVELVDYR